MKYKVSRWRAPSRGWGLWSLTGLSAASPAAAGRPSLRDRSPDRRRAGGRLGAPLGASHRTSGRSRWPGAVRPSRPDPAAPCCLRARSPKGGAGDGQRRGAGRRRPPHPPRVLWGVVGGGRRGFPPGASAPLPLTPALANGVSPVCRERRVCTGCPASVRDGYRCFSPFSSPWWMSRHHSAVFQGGLFGSQARRKTPKPPYI